MRPTRDKTWLVSVRNMLISVCISVFREYTPIETGWFTPRNCLISQRVDK